MIHMYTKTSQQVNRTMVDNEARYEVIASGVGPSKERGHSVAPSSRPHHIIEDMRKEYGVNISYGEARCARELPMLLLEVLQKTHTSFCMLMEKH